VEDTVRISVPIDRELHDRLRTLLPWGTKAQVVRELLILLLDTQNETEGYIVQDLLAGDCKLLIINKETVQNLNG